MTVSFEGFEVRGAPAFILIVSAIVVKWSNIGTKVVKVYGLGKNYRPVFKICIILIYNSLCITVITILRWQFCRVHSCFLDVHSLILLPYILLYFPIIHFELRKVIPTDSYRT